MAYSEPEFAPWDGRRVPMTLLAGYLGAGKTTLINELLAVTDRPIAVLVNDVGAVNVDAALIRRQSGSTIELTDGCICCSLNSGFGAAIEQVRAAEQPPDHVIVELSGVAEPDRLRPWGSVAGFRLDGVVVLVDADQLVAQLADPIVGSLVRAQIRAADLLLITKSDLVDSAELRTIRDQLTSLAPAVPVRTTHDPSDGASLLALGGRRPAGPTDLPPPRLFDRHHTEHITPPEALDEDGVHRLLDELAPSVVRAKGILGSSSDRPWLVQVVGRRRLVLPLPGAEHLAPTGLVVIHHPGDGDPADDNPS